MSKVCTAGEPEGDVRHVLQQSHHVEKNSHNEALQSKQEIRLYQIMQKMKMKARWRWKNLFLTSHFRVRASFVEQCAGGSEQWSRPDQLIGYQGLRCSTSSFWMSADHTAAVSSQSSNQKLVNVSRFTCIYEFVTKNGKQLHFEFSCMSAHVCLSKHDLLCVCVHLLVCMFEAAEPRLPWPPRSSSLSFPTTFIILARPQL